MEIISIYPFSTWLIILLASFFIGLGKAGLKGIDMLSVTLMAFVFGSKSSTGMVLPLLCLSDIAAVSYYHRHAQWNHFWKITPWMVIGILIGIFVGKDMNEVLFRKIMAIIILLTIVIIVVMEYRKSKQVPTNPFFVVGTGLAAGFTTMLGNLAGAFSNLYFLAMRLDKNDFIGTAAWIFLCMNLFKLPFQIFLWKNISMQSLQIDAILLPTLAIGFLIGLKLVNKVKEANYRKLIIILTLFGSLMMLFKR
ncbi:MAG: sulfite exporter TauE/SafE family protein [Bacteroidetes bacterium]|nr:sulfite exporter TauE/SafE family protein [Bacteroidota bacterium]